MPIRGSTVKPECHIAVNMHRFRAAGSNDPGRAGNGKHSTLWNVFISGKSTGRSRNSCGARSSDTTALHATDNRHVDSDFSSDNDRWKAVSDE